MIENKALKALREAKDDIEKLELLSNQFRTCFLVISAPPSGSLNGDPEIKNFMEAQRSRFEEAELDELLNFIDTTQAHLVYFSKLAREKSKVKIKGEIEERAQKHVKDRDALREAKAQQRAGNVHVDKDGDRVKDTSTLAAGVEPIDKKTHKAIQGIMKAMGMSYQDARKMVESMQIKKIENPS